MKETHKQLQDIALHWLYGVGCNVFAKEVPTKNGIADALGVKTSKNDVYYLECKASRSDLICQKQKQVYRRAVGDVEDSCYYHSWNNGEHIFDPERPRSSCDRCKAIDKAKGDTGVDFYYIVVAEGVKVEPTLYPLFGVINHKGKIVRRAKRMKQGREHHTHDAILAAAHVLVYKAYGKLYFGHQIL